MNWDDEIEIAGMTVLAPEPRLMDAIGLNHELETAIADLVDNSLDAGARQVLVRFVRQGHRLVGLCVVDDGRGMSESDIDRAMTVGGQRDYADGDLGHFGFGLKAASLGQADSLTLASRANGSDPCGRRWLTHKAASTFECELLTDASAGRILGRDWGMVIETGSVVRWDAVRAFPRSSRTETTDRYLEDTVVRVRTHLGLIFHRILAKRDVSIVVDVEDLDVSESSIPMPVEPIDPFGYIKTGASGFPRALTVSIGDSRTQLHLHIWTPRSQLDGFRLGRVGAIDAQGFYFYRNDRLLQAGGWNGVVHPDRRLQLARVAVEVDGRLTSHFTMNPEKTAVRVSPAFVTAVEEANDNGMTFSNFLERASSVFQAAQKRNRSRPKVIPPGRGFAPAIRKAVSVELEFLPGREPIDIRWTDLDDESFFVVDRTENVIWLNKQYRWAVLGERDSSLNDAPLLKAALYLLLEDLFRGEYMGAKDKDNVQMWGAILAAAARAKAQ
jgi:hypothetical protein